MDSDCKETFNFSLHFLTRIENDDENTLSFLTAKYNQIKVLYRMLQRKSPKYPYLDYDTIVKYLQDINHSSYYMVGMNRKLKL